MFSSLLAKRVQKSQRAQLARRRYRPLVESCEARQLLATSPLTVTITEVQTGQSVTVGDNTLNDLATSLESILYNATGTSPFTDFSIQGVQLSSNNGSGSNVDFLFQSATIIRTTSTPGIRTLTITASEGGFTTPIIPQFLYSSSSVTFTNATAQDSSTFQSFYNSIASPIVTLTPNLANNPDSENGTPAPVPLTGSAPFSLSSIYTVNLGPSTASAVQSVTYNDTGTTAVTGVNNNAQVSGVVFADQNQNLTEEGTETGIAGVTVTLTGHDSNGNAVTLTTLTGANGAYSFTNLVASDANGYTVTETQPTGYYHEGQVAGSTGGTTTDHAINILVNDGDVSTANNFAEEAPAALSGLVFLDTNNNLTFNTGDSGIAGVVVKLTGTDDAGNPVSLSTTTNSSGAYSFSNLRPSNASGYTVTETAPANYVHEGQVAGSTGGTTATYTIKTVLGGGANSTGNNFAEQQPVVGPTASQSISGTVFIDGCGNGSYAGNKAEKGVVVQLLNSSGKVIGSYTTGTNGTFAFYGLTPGTQYYVQEVTPNGALDTGTDQGNGYSVKTTNSAVSGLEFDNYFTPDTSNITKVYYTVTDTRGRSTVVSDLRGNVDQGDTVKVTFTVVGSPAVVSLASYTAPESYFVAADAAQQKVYKSSSATFSAGTHTLSVVVPNSYYQVDFVEGCVITQFGPAGGNIFYSAQNRLISADNGGTTAPRN